MATAALVILQDLVLLSADREEIVENATTMLLCAAHKERLEHRRLLTS